MSYTYSQKAIDLFVEGLENHDPEPLKPIKPVRVKVNGKYIYTKSGKSLWKTVGHAKSAIKHHFCSMYQNPLEKEVYYGNQATGYKEHNAVWAGFIKHLEEKGILEFVPA